MHFFRKGRGKEDGRRIGEMCKNTVCMVHLEPRGVGKRWKVKRCEKYARIYK